MPTCCGSTPRILPTPPSSAPLVELALLPPACPLTSNPPLLVLQSSTRTSNLAQLTLPLPPPKWWTVDLHSVNKFLGDVYMPFLRKLIRGEIRGFIRSACKPTFLVST